MNKKYTLLWRLSLLIIAVVTVIWAGCSLAGVRLPDTAVRIMGVLDLCAVPVLIYTSIKRREE